MTALVHKMERQNVVSQKTRTYIDPAGNHHSFTIKTVEKWDSKKKVWFIDSVIIGYPEGLLQIPHNFEGTRIAHQIGNSLRKLMIIIGSRPLMWFNLWNKAVRYMEEEAWDLNTQGF